MPPSDKPFRPAGDDFDSLMSALDAAGRVIEFSGDLSSAQWEVVVGRLLDLSGKAAERGRSPERNNNGR